MYDCQRCGSVEAYIHFGSEMEKKVLCIGCYNAMMSEVLGVKAETCPEGISIRGGDDTVRHFSIKTPPFRGNQHGCRGVKVFWLSVRRAWRVGM